MERRNSPRLVVNHPVWIIGLNGQPERDEQLLGYAIDIRESGMLLEVQGDVVKNKIKVFASITNNRVIEITGRIICCDSSGSGYSKIRLKFEGNFRARRTFYNEFVQAVRLRQRIGSYSTEEVRT
jgi:hypothetical protein